MEDNAQGQRASTTEPAPEAPEDRDIHSGARLVPVKSAAQRVGIDRKTVDRWIRAGKLQAQDRGGFRVVLLDEVERLAYESRRARPHGQGHTSPQDSAPVVAVLEAQVATLTEALARAQAGEERALLMLPQATEPIRQELESVRSERDALRDRLEDATSERISLERENARLAAEAAARRGFWARVLGR